MSRRETVIDAVCDQRHQMPLLLTVVVVMAVLLAISVAITGPDALGRPIVVLDAALLVVAFIALAVGFRYCTKREMDEE